MGEVPRCPRCGHNFYLGMSAPPNAEGLCQWCEDEVKEPSILCHVCGADATCTTEQGYLCDKEKCLKIDKLLAEIEFIKRYE
jgi:hypothetical protein